VSSTSNRTAKNRTAPPTVKTEGNNNHFRSDIKYRAIGKVSYLGQERIIDLSTLDLSQLIGGRSFTIPSQVGKNRHNAQVDSLIDTGANGYAFMDIACAADLRKLCQIQVIRLRQACYVKGYDGRTKQAVTHVIFLDLSINGRRIMDMPFLIADLGQNQIILGRRWIAGQDVWLDVRNQRLIWPNERPAEGARLRRELVTSRDSLVKPAPNPIHQGVMKQRDRAIEKHKPKNQILKRSPENKYTSPRTYTMDWRANLKKMNRELAGKVDEAIPRKHSPRVPQRNLPS
jgi:predicted aspartyl protease